MPGKHKKKKGILSYQKKSPYSYSVDHDKEMVYIKDNSSGKTYSESYSKYPDLTQGARDSIMDRIRSSKKKGVKSYAKSGTKKFSAMSELISAPKEIKPEGKPKEKLIYANDEEISMLKKAGGMGVPTQYGVRSYEKKKENDIDVDTGGMGMGEGDKSESQKAFEAAKKGYDYVTGRKFNEGGGDGNNNNQPVDTTETRPYEGDGVTLKGLYKAISEGKLKDYLDKFKSRTETSTNASGGTHTITYEGLDHGISDSMTEDDWYKDQNGNIIGWKDADGQPQFENSDEWYVDNEGNWFYVGTGAVGGAGGEGQTTIIGEDGTYKTIGPRAYADLLGFDQDLLDMATQDRANTVAQLAGRGEMYGGTYTDSAGRKPGDPGFDAGSATFKGGMEQEAYAKADVYEEDYKRLMGDAESKLDQAESRFDEYGAIADRQTRELARLAQDRGFYEGLQKDTSEIQKDIKSYRGRIGELADRGLDTPRGMQQSLFAQMSEQIDDDANAQQSQLRQMLAERGISPTSSLGLKMAQEIRKNSATSKRQARRSALTDAMSMQMAENQQRTQMYQQAAGLTGGEMQAIQQRAGIRGQRMQGLGAGAMAAQQQGQYAGGTSLMGAEQRMRMAGMQAAQSSEQFSRGSYFGQQARDITQLRMAEAMDREANQEYKKLTGMQMDLSKYGLEQEKEIAEKLMAMKESSASGGARSNLVGSLVGGLGGYFMSGGNPYMAGLGAQWGSNINIG